ncbi:MAG: tetratricopeptide repeat protein [Calditrichaceae bacterium]
MKSMMNKMSLTRLFLLVLLYGYLSIQTVYGQADQTGAQRDSLFDKVNLDELIKIKKYYEQNVNKLRSEEEKSRNEGLKVGEDFLTNKASKVENRDHIYIRIAEYYIEDADRNYDQQVEKYDKTILEYEKKLALFDAGEISEEPKMPSFPVHDYTKGIEVYDRLLNEYPASDYADDALYNKAWLLERMRRGNESRRLYQEVIDKYPDSPFAPESYIQLAEYYFSPRDDKDDEEQGIVELKKAIQLYKKVLKYSDSKRYDEALYKLGWSYYKLAARDPLYYNDAITYFMAVADDITLAKKLDPSDKISNPNVRDEAIEYIGISFTDEAYTMTGVDKARKLLERLGEKEYGVEIMRAIGQTYQKIDEQDKAMYAFVNLLDMYPLYEEAPLMRQNIVNALYSLGRDTDAYQERDTLFRLYNPDSEWYTKLETSDKTDKLKYIDSAYKIAEAAFRTNILLDLEKAEQLNSEGLPSTEQYELFAANCKDYLTAFPTDSNAYDINWSYAFMLDSRLGRFEEAFEEYMRVSNDYLETSHQEAAALNAVKDADTLVVLKYGKGDTVRFNFADIAQLSPEALTPEETRLIEAYDNYIRLFPTGSYTPNFLAASGGIYYNHKKFAEAKVYFQTLVKRFPGAKEKSLALRSIMDSYFALGKFKDSEIIAKRIMSDDRIPDEQREFAEKRLGQAIFKNAEFLSEQGDYFAAAGEFVRINNEVANDPLLVESALYNGGLNYQKAKDWVRAIETFDILASQHPKSKFAIDALENMADDYKELEQYVNAGQTYERIYTNYTDTKNAEIALYNASYYFEKGKEWLDAIRVNNMYITAFPSQPYSVDLFFKNAQLYLNSDNITEANGIYAEFATRYPDDPRTVTAFYERGNYYLDNGQETAAKVEFNKAIQKSEAFRKSGKDPNAYIAGEAVNKLAGILHTEFTSIKMTQPKSNIDYQQERLKNLLTELNQTYSKVLTFGSPRSFEATYNTAKSYEEFARIYASQEIDPNLDVNKFFLEKKRINEQSAALFQKSVDEYKNVVTNIPILAEKLGVDLYVSADSTMDVVDAGSDTTAVLARAAERDSTRELGIKFQEKARDKVSELQYTMASLTSENIYYALDVKPPNDEPLTKIIFEVQLFQQAVSPAITQTIESHLSNIKEAEAMGLSNKYVEESKRQILLTSNILAEEFESLVDVALGEYTSITRQIMDLVEKEFGTLNAKGQDYYALDNSASQMIDFTKILSEKIIDSYTKTLVLAQENGIQNDIVRNTQDRLLRYAVEITDRMSGLSDSANAISDNYTVKFDSTENYNFDDAKVMFETYYYSFNDNSLAILENAYKVRQDYDIKNLWANKLLYKLIKLDPVTYSASIEKEKIIVSSDESWLYTKRYYGDQWTKSEFNDSDWSSPQIVPDYNNQFAALGVNPKSIWISQIPLTSQQTSLSAADTLAVADSLNLNIQPDTSATMVVVDTSALVSADTVAFFRKEFQLDGTPVSGEIFLTADDDFRFYLNGEYIIDDSDNSFAKLDTLDYYTFDIFLKPGSNQIAIDVEDKDMTAGGLKFYGTFDILPADITAAAQEKAKVKTYDVDVSILKKINILNKNRISVNQ